MKKTFLIILTVMASARVGAQVIKAKSIDVMVGYGLCAPYDDHVDITGSGFYLQGEYVLKFDEILDIRSYAGLILTKPDNYEKNLPDYKSTANAFLLGSKARVIAPINWVALYLELGIGASIGSFETITKSTNIEKSGIIFHIPVSIGLELGRKRNFDIAFTYYFHPSVKQFAGAIALGVSIPINI